jgi:diguanylate cyclase (GGDEF)-like protein/PAS domain S-box-containing protein
MRCSPPELCRPAPPFFCGEVKLTDQPYRQMLVVEGEPSTIEEIRRLLADPYCRHFRLEHVAGVSEALDVLDHKQVDVILVDLSQDSSLGTFERMVAAAPPNVPIVILATKTQEAIALKAVARGADDYLLLNRLDGYSLFHVLNSALARKVIEGQLFVKKDPAETTLDSIGDAVLCTDTSGNVAYMNAVAENMTGWSRAEASGRPLKAVFQIIDGATREPVRNPLKMAVDLDRTVGLTANCVLISRDATEAAIEDSAAPIHDQAGHITGAVIVFHDVSAARATSEEMTHLARHDAVTGLPNRLLLTDRISQALALARRHVGSMAVMFLDLDTFKSVNDSLGHAAGDKLLQSVAKRLLNNLRSSDTVCRQGGDEFIILLPEIAHPEDAAKSANKLLLAISEPHIVQEKPVSVTCSIGISLYPEDGDDVESLIHNADMAMYHAKEKGRNTIQFFEAEMNARAVARRTLESSLRAAIQQNEFLLYYQPKVDLRTGDITGVEALVRWQHPVKGLLLPDCFIPVAEDCGLIVQIGRWVLREACRQARAWQGAGLLPLPISVNVSAIEFRNEHFVESVQSILSETGLEGRYLEMELTERVLMKDAASTTAVLNELKRMGIRLAVDDFGTGFSSLSYLRRFPIDVLKIDKSFVHEISVELGETALVRTIIDMGNSLRHLVVAEGIETRQQKEYLQSHSCGEGQGFLFSYPLPAFECAHLLATGIIRKTELFA